MAYYEQAPAPYHHAQPEPHAPQGQLVRIFCKADKAYNLAVRNNTPVMVPARSDDPSQLWMKDMSPAQHTQDNYGSPAFTLINEATRKVLKHGKKEGTQLSVVDYRPGHIDEDLLFSESQDFGEGFRSIRMARGYTPRSRYLAHAGQPTVENISTLVKTLLAMLLT
ncbi:hypothetical protein GOP47_0012294 [Adiantum capillus-veneris]|uniref:Uncharacterized protein n=1 Tax=Adiantum capillus-veneris TaxID=13818 RepID=A0A9D4ZE64_ADICA|nr:hypothetical protein GOP47_0012294 [Adiantum capillus-veneris]